MKVLMCVFSGTGNTLKVAESLAEELTKYDCDCDVYRIRAGAEPSEPDKYDMLILGHPVHAFNAPTAFLAFLAALPDGNGKKAYIIRTSGEPLKFNDAAGITPRRILKKRGYDVLGEFSYVMPYNIIFRHSDGMAARMWQSALLRIKRNASEIADLAANKCKVGPIRRAVSFTLRIEHTAMPLIGRRFKVDLNKCLRCGLCVSLCPRGNITLNDKPTFGKSCVGCMACSFGCPHEAIKISLLNGWRVNGGYTFEGTPSSDEEVCKYCRKSYLKYFHESENLRNATEFELK